MQSDNTIMAFLLAFQDLNTSLSPEEKQNLKEVAEELNIQPRAWEPHIKRDLLTIIKGNSDLHQSYTFYKSKLDQLETIPDALLPTVAEIRELNPVSDSLIARGYWSEEQPTDSHIQLNNVVVTVGYSQEPEATVKKAKFLDRLRRLITGDNA